MATRFYLTNSAPDFMPATVRGAWDATGSAVSRALSTTKAGTTGEITRPATSKSGDKVLLGRFISPPITVAGTLSGNGVWIMNVRQSSTSANASSAGHVYVIAGSTDTVRGTLLSNYQSSSEWRTTFEGWGNTLPNGQSLTSVNCQVGDRIVFEFGWWTGTNNTSYNASIRYGGTGPDLTADDNSTNNVPWIEFSGADALFVPVAAPPTGAFFAFFD